MKTILFFVCAVLTTQFVSAQNVGMGRITPHSSAMLDVVSTNKGLLVPRVALTATNIAAPVTSPATSLLVYNTATIADVTPGYYYWSSSAWLRVATGTSSGGTGWLLSGNAGTVDGTNFIGTTDNVPFNITVNNQKAGRIDPALYNSFWGYLAGNANTTGGSNTANGGYALYANTTGELNAANGRHALQANTEGTANTANGVYALYSNTTGRANTANGINALRLNKAGYSNVAVGVKALYENTTQSNLVAVGDSALHSSNGGSRNTAVGSKALFLCLCRCSQNNPPLRIIPPTPLLVFSPTTTTPKRVV